MTKTKQPRKLGRFDTLYSEKRAAPIAMRLPVSLDQRLRSVAGANIRGWIEQAIAEKLDRDE